MASKSTATSAKDNGPSEKTSLLDLPPELWISVGRMLIEDEPSVTNNDFEMRFPPGRTARNPTQPAITRTCRVLRGELLPYYYQTKYHIRLYQSNGTSKVRESNVAIWLRQMPVENLRAVRNTSLELFDMSKGHMTSKALEEVAGKLFKAGVKLVEDEHWAAGQFNPHGVWRGFKVEFL